MFSFRDKVDKVRLATDSCPFEVIALFETWLNSGISDVEHFGKRYNVFRGDRSAHTSDRTDGGGVLVAVESKFDSEKINLCNDSGLEHVCVKIKLIACNIFIFAVYVRSVREREKFLEFAETVIKIPYDENDIVIVCGDFNQPGIKWVKADDGDYYLPMNVTTEGGLAVIETMLSSGFHQMCNIANQAGNVLDLVFTNKFYDLSMSESTKPLMESDAWHKAIELELLIERSEEETENFNEIYSYEVANFEAMNEFFAECEIIHSIDHCDRTEDAFEMLENCISEAIEKFVPKIVIKKSNDPPWYNKQLKHLNNVRRKEFNRGKNSEQYRRAVDAFVALQSQLFQSYINRIQSEIKSNPKHFWRFVNDRRKRSEIPSTIEYNDRKAATDTSKAELFADFFERQYTPSDEIDIDSLLNACEDEAFDFVVNEEDVLKALLTINVNKGTGPDGVPPKLLKNCAHTLMKPLTILFNKSLQTGSVPDNLKKSRIVPIFKSGKKSNAANYRPIVIIPTVAKLFESIVHTRIKEFVNGKIAHNQHGFVKNRSTATNLLQMVNYTMDSMIQKCQTDVLYTDFEKAFDRVDHKRLLQKLARFGFGRRLVKWFHAYLTSRTQFVGIGNGKSKTFTVTSGVPAGSILGPCLFIIFINDIVDTVTNVLVLLFADDLKLILKIANSNDARVFQSAIDQLYDWCTLNKLYLNLKKCFIMTYARTSNVRNYEYTINNGQHTFDRIQLHRDLGVIFDVKLTFSNHIETIEASARAALGFIKRTLKNKFTIDTAKMLYFALVRSKLEYASVVWHPYHQSYIDKIESIQKGFVIWSLREIYQRDNNFRLPSYEFRCNNLNIQPLWRRRINASVFLIYDLLLEKLICDALRHKIEYTRRLDNRNRRNVRNSDLVRIEVFSTDYARMQPFILACRNFNKVRQTFLESASRKIFIRNVVNLENNVFDELYV